MNEWMAASDQDLVAALNSLADAQDDYMGQLLAAASHRIEHYLEDIVAAVRSLADDPADPDLWENAADLIPSPLFEAVEALHKAGE